MSKCPECKKETRVIGTQKFEIQGYKNFESNEKQYTIMLATYCEECNVIILREPKTIYG